MIFIEEIEVNLVKNPSVHQQLAKIHHFVVFINTSRQNRKGKEEIMKEKTSRKTPNKPAVVQHQQEFPHMGLHMMLYH